MIYTKEKMILQTNSLIEINQTLIDSMFHETIKASLPSYRIVNVCPQCKSATFIYTDSTEVTADICDHCCSKIDTVVDISQDY